MAMTPAERKREQRERDRQRAAGHEAALLVRKVTTPLYRRTDEALERLKQETGIEEDQDIITRLIHGADRLAARHLEDLIRIA